MGIYVKTLRYPCAMVALSLREAWVTRIDSATIAEPSRMFTPVVPRAFRIKTPKNVVDIES
jgi:hypothetical protein